MKAIEASVVLGMAEHRLDRPGLSRIVQSSDVIRVDFGYCCAGASRRSSPAIGEVQRRAAIVGGTCSLAMTRPRRPVPGVDALRAICGGPQHKWFDQAVLPHSDRPGGGAATSRLIGVPGRGSATLGGRSAENVSPELSRR